MEPPTLSTERLVLRQWRNDDFEGYRALAEDPEVARFIGGVVRGGQAWRQMAMHAGHWTLRGYGNWAVDWCWQAIDAEAVLSLIHPDNEPSLRLARRLGFGVERTSEVNGEPVVVHRLERPGPPRAASAGR